MEKMRNAALPTLFCFLTVLWAETLFYLPLGVWCGSSHTAPFNTCRAYRTKARDGWEHLCSLPGAQWAGQRVASLPLVDTARGKVQKMEASTAQELFVCFVLTEPRSIGVGIGTADRDNLNRDSTGLA